VDAVKEKAKTGKLKREVAGVLFLFLGVFLFLALMSYHPEDPSLNRAGTAVGSVHNYLGLVGAYTADLLYQGFGLGAFLFAVFFFALAGKKLFRARSTEETRSRIFLALRTSGLIGLLLTGATFSGLVWGEFMRGGQPVPAGGLVGNLVARVLDQFLNHGGAYALLILVFLISMMLAFEFSPVRMVDYALDAGAWLKEIFSRLWTMQTQKRKRKQDVRKEKERLTLVKTVTEPRIIESAKAEKKPPRAQQESFSFSRSGKSYVLPSLKLLDSDMQAGVKTDRESLLMNARVLEKKLLDFGVAGEVVEVMPGPVITMYEFKPGPGVKINKIMNLADDLALSLSAISVRIIAPLPGQGVVGIEIPNKQRETVYLKELVSSSEFERKRSLLPMALGKDILGQPFVFDLRKAPHLLVAGATGSGKSVSLNAMIMSVLYRSTPDPVRMLLIDPKRLELSLYEGIPHLLHSVISDPKDAALSLRWAVAEMERRYALLAERGVRNIDAYNLLVDRARSGKKKTRRRRTRDEESTVVIERSESEPPAEPLPLILMVIDELADLMMVAARDCEESITRLAQMARAAGIHIIVATQRPSVDVITGLIKANFPARMSFQVSSKTDSRTILDANGAERLLGQGDMLYLAPGTSRLIRLHGAYVSEAEISRVVSFWKKQGKPVYDEEIVRPVPDEDALGRRDEADELYDHAVALVAQTKQASISMLQRRLRVGYNRAARMIERMEAEGLVGPSEGVKPREVYIDPIHLEGRMSPSH
jgi:S-DNA-T family DNA segregation ATPase FtsK/SpoIIIE